MTIVDRIAAIISRAQEFGGMYSTDPQGIADDIIAELGLEQESHWGPVSVAEFDDEGSPIMDDRMCVPTQKHHLEWVNHKRWVTSWEEVGERETSEQVSARLT